MVQHFRAQVANGTGCAAIERQHQIWGLPREPGQRQSRRFGTTPHGPQPQSPLFGQFHSGEDIVQDRVAAEHRSVEGLHLFQRDRFHRFAGAFHRDGVRRDDQLALGAFDPVVAVHERINDTFAHEFEEGLVCLSSPRRRALDRVGQFVAQPLKRLLRCEYLRSVKVLRFLRPVWRSEWCPAARPEA